MQMAHVYVHSVSKESRRSEKASVPYSPARSTRSCLGQSNGLESHVNTVSVHIHTRRAMRKLESICERVSNTELAYQECSIAHGGSQKPRDRMDASDTRAHVQDLANDSRRSTNKPECVRTPKDSCTKSNPPGTSPECAQQSHRGQGTTQMHRARARARTATDLTRKRLQKHAKMSAYLRIKQNGPTHLMAQRPGAEMKRMSGGNHADGSTVLADTQSVETDPKTAKIATRNVRTCQVGPRRQNLPYRLEIKTPKRPGQQNHVSIDGNNVHAPHNTPIEALGTRNRRIVL